MTPSPPLNKYELRQFQKEGVEFLLKNRTALLADEVGVGKTAQFLTAARECGAKSILIICPASIKWDYPHRGNQWGIDPKRVHVITPQNAKTFGVHIQGVFVMNYDICHRKEVAKFFSRKKYDVLICDESHYLKNQKSLRSKAAFGAGGYVSLSQRIWFVTGTPVLNKPEELFTTLNSLCPERIAPYNDYISFTIRYCGGHKGPWGWVADGATHVEELAKRLEGFMLRRERDVLPELPEKIMNVIHLQRTAAIERGLYEERPHSDSPGDVNFLHNEIQTSVRQKMGIAKVPEVIKYVREQLESGAKKLILFAYHHAVINALFIEFINEANTITGKDYSEDKQLKIDRFINDSKLKILICQIDAVGTGVDGLQGVCNHAIFAEISYVPGINNQAMGRIHRNGQKHKTIFDFLTVEGSIDENILDQNILKSGVIKSLMQDENRGFDFRKKVKKEIAMLEEVLTRIANALDKQTELLERSVNFQLSGVRQPSALNSDGSLPAKAEEIEQPKKGRGKAKPVAEAPSTFDAVANGAPAVPTEHNKGIAAESPIADPFAAASLPAAVKVPTVQTFEEFVKGTAATIQAKVGAKEPLKINQVLGELNQMLKKEFPQYAHVLKITDKDEQDKVIGLINNFMIAKGLYA